MRVDCFDFFLPKTHIALRPVKPRDHARLLHVKKNKSHQAHNSASHNLNDYKFYELPKLLRKGDILVFNDAKVINARLKAIRIRKKIHDQKISNQTLQYKANIEITLNQKLKDTPLQWSAFAKPARKIKCGDSVYFDPVPLQSQSAIRAEISYKGVGGIIHLTFPDMCPNGFMRHIAHIGQTPLPPYILAQRHADRHDRDDYQTVFAQKEGAVAAPTAGLHFTHPLLHTLKDKGIDIAFVTLFVSAGTFLPIKTKNICDHVMYSEYGVIDAKTAHQLTQARKKGRRIIAVGTTALRLLETATDDNRITKPFSAETSLFITPGYQFKAIDMLITNFHLPKSTLFMLVCAFSGIEVMHDAYAHAIRENYRVYSYGDACLLEAS